MRPRMAEALASVVATVQWVAAGLSAREVGLGQLRLVHPLLCAAPPLLRHGPAPAALPHAHHAIPTGALVADARAPVATAGEGFVADGAAGLRGGLGHRAASELVKA